MSLVAQALIALTHYVLDGATWAGDRISEQPVEPIDELLRGADSAQKPVIAVYVESAKMPISGRETQGNKGNLDLKVFVYIAPGRVKLPVGTAFALDGKQAGLTLNILGRQVDAAFHTSLSAWLPVWHRFVISVEEREVRYMLVEVENAVKIPTMEITYRLRSIPDPDFGTPLYGAWSMLDAALRTAGGEKAVLADLIKSLIENPAGLASYQDLQMNFGLTDDGLAATGLGPIHPDAVDEDTGEPSELDTVIIDSDVIVSPDEP